MTVLFWARLVALVLHVACSQRRFSLDALRRLFPAFADSQSAFFCVAKRKNSHDCFFLPHPLQSAQPTISATFRARPGRPDQSIGRLQNQGYRHEVESFSSLAGRAHRFRRARQRRGHRADDEPRPGCTDHETSGLEEVLVTATRAGETNLQQTPISVTAVSAEDINRMVGKDISAASRPSCRASRRRASPPSTPRRSPCAAWASPTSSFTWTRRSA